MSKAKNKPGIHLLQTGLKHHAKIDWYWHVVSKNGRIIARSSETYSSKRSAKKSILVAAEIFLGGKPYELVPYYDHSKPNSPKLKYV